MAMMIFQAFFKREPKPQKPSNTPLLADATAWVPLPPANALIALTPARQALWEQNNPHLCLRLLPINPLYYQGILPAHWVNSLLIDLTGEAYLASQQYERAAQLFQRYGLPERAGWAWVLAGNLQQAMVVWQPFLQHATATQEAYIQPETASLKPILANQAQWLVSQWGLLNNQVQQWPTLLQLRNAIENDVTQLVQANQLTGLNAYLAKIDWLGQVNIEVYKLVGRSLFYLGLFAPAHRLLLQAQAIVPTDAEVYYHLAEYYQACKQPLQAKPMLQQCLWINPQYQPAQVLLYQCTN
jgi:tetratricopeptide (TPR) repeat protein